MTGVDQYNAATSDLPTRGGVLQRFRNFRIDGQWDALQMEFWEEVQGNRTSILPLVQGLQ